MKSRLEQRIDKELEELGVKPYVYHIRAYGEGSSRRLLRLFNGITIVDLRQMETVDVEHDVGELIDELRWKCPPYYNEHDIQPATWMMAEMREFEYYGVAICDNRDNFSRKRGRIIAKGRLLKYLRNKNGIM